MCEEALAFTCRNSGSYMQELFLIKALLMGFFREFFVSILINTASPAAPQINRVGGCWV
jgi:hypothetical protein